MTHETVVVGPLTRDFTRQGVMRWSQPGGAVWHAGLALSLPAPAPEAAVSIYATAGPWARRWGLPGLHGAGVGCCGAEAARDTVFLNRYEGERREQALLSSSEPLPMQALTGCRPAAAVIAPLMPHDVARAAGAAWRACGAFVAVDAQGILRARRDSGRIVTRTADLRDFVANVQALKFSQRAFGVYAGISASPGAADWEAAACAIATELGVEIVISRGLHGAVVATPRNAGIAVAPSRLLSSSEDASPVDATGAGDILTATYARARSTGAEPKGALERAVRETGVVLAARAAVGARRGELLASLRALQLASAVARRRERAGDSPTGGFSAEGDVARSLVAALPALSLPLDSRSRAEALVSTCWALFSVGWPADGPRPAALCALAEAELGR